MIAVTKLIDLLNKPALLGWANKLGLKGIDLKEYQKQVQSQGNSKHNEIERFLKYGEIFEGYEKLEKLLEKYEIVGVEEEITNDFLIGRIDLILKNGNEIIVCDFKRNKNIYLGTKLQLSTYKHMLNADKIAYINFDKFELVEINIDTNKYYELMKRLYQIYVLLRDLNERL